MNYEVLSIETAKKLEIAEKIINELEEYLDDTITTLVIEEMDFDIEIYEEILDKLKELKDKYDWK